MIFYCQHQTAPFPARIWIPPFADPISSNVSPYVRSWLNVIGTNMAAYLDAAQHAGSDLGVALRQLVCGVYGLGGRVSQRDFVLHGDGALPVCDAALLHGG